MGGLDGLIGAITTQLVEALVRAKSAEDKADAAVKMAADCMKELLVLKASYDPFAPRPGDAQAAPEAPPKVSPFTLDRAIKDEAPPKVSPLEGPISDDAMVQEQIWGDAIADV